MIFEIPYKAFVMFPYIILNADYSVLRSLLPDYWMMVGTYSKSWDSKLNKLLDRHRFKDIGEFTAYLGKQEIWIRNHPYGSFTPALTHFRPKRSTIARAYKQLQKDMKDAKA